MTKPSDGGPAFPFVCADYSKTQFADPGMSLRDWFAGMTMQGISANPDSGATSQAQVAKWAYETADAMLAKREKNKPCNDQS